MCTTFFCACLGWYFSSTVRCAPGHAPCIHGSWLCASTHVLAVSNLGSFDGAVQPWTNPQLHIVNWSALWANVIATCNLQQQAAGTQGRDGVGMAGRSQAGSKR